MDRLKIKVCGMRRADNIRAVASLPIDMMGFIFCPSSKRYVGNQAGVKDVPTGGIKRVGVFVDATVQEIISRMVEFRLDAVQLHGSESPTFVRNLCATVCTDLRPHLRIIKAISISGSADIEQCGQYEGVADMFVFDTKCPTYGGSGRQFDWSLLDAYHGTVPFLLSGGIGPGDAGMLRAVRHPRFAGIDLNSRFETAPGVKDVDMLRRFIGEL